MKNSRKTGFRLSPTSKKLTSPLQSDHLDYQSKTHQRDREATQKNFRVHTGDAELDGIVKDLEVELLAQANADTKNTQEKLTIEELVQSHDLRDNLAKVDGEWYHLTGNDTVDHHTAELKWRSHYSLSDGSRIGPKNRKFLNPLHVTYARLPPWVALHLKDDTHAESLKIAAVSVAEDFCKKLGHDPISIHLHRETKHDLHIHIVHSDVIEHHVEVDLSQRKKQTWIREQKTKIKNELKEHGSPATPLAVKLEYESRKLSPPTSENLIELRKIRKSGDLANLQNWPIQKRPMVTLGVSYRHKANLYNAALDEGRKTTIKNTNEWDHAGSFTARYLNCPSPREDYFDYDLEQSFIESVENDVLSANEYAYSLAGSSIAVDNYLKTGSSLNDNLKRDSNRRLNIANKRLKSADHKLDKALTTEQHTLITQANAELTYDHTAYRDQKLILREAQLGMDAQQLRFEARSQEKKLTQQQAAIVDRKRTLSKMEADLATRSRSLNMSENELKNKANELATREAKLGDKERENDRLKSELIDQENKVTSQKQSFDQQEADLRKWEHEVREDIELTAIQTFAKTLGLKQKRVLNMDSLVMPKTKDAKYLSRPESKAEFKKRCILEYRTQMQKITQLAKVKGQIQDIIEDPTLKETIKNSPKLKKLKKFITQLTKIFTAIPDPKGKSQDKEKE